MGLLSGLLGAVSSVLPVASGVVNVLGGVSGLMGKNKEKTKSPAANLMSQAAGARAAAAKYGFNPLTMLQYGQTGGSIASGGGGAPPLASVEMLTTGLKGLDDIASGDAARRRQADQLELDMAKLALDRARSGVVQITNNAVDAFSSPSPLGRPAANWSQSNIRAVEPRLSSASVGGKPNASLSRPSGSDLPDGIPVPPSFHDRGTGAYVGGKFIEPTPGWSPASVIEDEYGDGFVSEAYSLSKAMADATYNMGIADGDLTGWYQSMANPSAVRPVQRPFLSTFYADKRKNEAREKRAQKERDRLDAMVNSINSGSAPYLNIAD